MVGALLLVEETLQSRVETLSLARIAPVIGRALFEAKADRDAGVGFWPESDPPVRCEGPGGERWRYDEIARRFKPEPAP